jgi:tRNA pseudouridine38-40 synthase
MPIIRLVLEYEGTAYAGWQRQANGTSIQEVVETALAQVLREEVRLHSSGRTDAGVHARGMIAHFSTTRRLPVSAYCAGVNRFLPGDIAILEATEETRDFHSRFSARGKWYRYLIQQGPVRAPLNARFSWHLRKPLDLSAMREAAALFIGLHDFVAFRGAGCNARTTEREIFSVDISSDGNLLVFDIRGKGFLRHMVRIMVGTLVEVGLGLRPVHDISRLLQRGCRESAGRTAPPQGLCLMQVWYEGASAKPDRGEEESLPSAQIPCILECRG